MRDQRSSPGIGVNGVLQLAEFLGASWVLWRLSARAYRPRTPDDVRGVERGPGEADEPAARTVGPVTARGRR